MSQFYTFDEICRFSRLGIKASTAVFAYMFKYFFHIVLLVCLLISVCETAELVYENM